MPSLTNGRYYMNLNLEIESRGIRAKAGDATTEEAISVLKAANIDWQGTSQILTMSDLEVGR